jgi:predicted dehydrogenase
MLGLGQRGLQHLRSVYQLQQEGIAQIVTLADAFPSNIDPQKLQKFVPGLPTDTIQLTTDFDALLNSDIDALYLSIPPNVHKGEVVRAAQKGLHLFVEKPMSLFLDEAIEMQRAIADAGILATVGFQQRFDVRHDAVKNYLQGKQGVMVSYTRHGPLEGHSIKHTPTEAVGGPGNRVWTANRAWSGMTLVEGGIHPLDVWRYWFGDVEWVQATYSHRPPHEIYDGADNPYAYNAIFGFKNGVIGNMILSRLRRVYQSYGEEQVLWTEGRIELTDDAVIAYHYDGPYPPSTTPAAAELRHDVPVPDGENSTLAISRAFVNAVAHNDASLIRSPYDDAMNSLAAVLGANISDELGGQRVYLEALLTNEEFARFRQKPN